MAGWMREFLDGLTEDAWTPLSPAQLRELPRALGDDDEEVRGEALELFRVLTQVMHGDEVPVGPQAGRLQQCVWGAFDSLVLAAGREQTSALRATALEAIASCRDDVRARPVVLSALRDADVNVQDIALLWCAQRGDDAASPVLFDRLARCVAPGLWWEAEHGSVELPEGERVGLEERVTALLSGRLKAECQGDVAVAGLRCRTPLTHLHTTIDWARMVGVPAIAPLLPHLLDASRDLDMRRAVTEAMIEHVDARAVPSLVRALEHADIASVTAAVALCRRPFPAAAAALRHAATREAPKLHPNVRPVLRDAALRALAVQGDASAMAHAPTTRMGVATLALLAPHVARPRLLEVMVHEHFARLAAPVLGDVGVLRTAARGPLGFRAALGIAATDLAALTEAEVALLVNLPRHLDLQDFEANTLVLVEALARVARQKPTGRTALINRTLGALDAFRRVLEGEVARGVLCYRGRGSWSSLTVGYVLDVRDRLGPRGAAV